MKKPVQTDKLNTTNKASKWRTKVQHPYRTEVFFQPNASLSSDQP